MSNIDWKELFLSILKSFDEEYVFNILKKLTSFGGEFGFRLAGTQTEHEVANYIASEMEKIGLDDVRLCEVPVKAWNFHEAKLIIKEPINTEFIASTYAGIGGGEAEGEVVFVGTGTSAELDAIDLTGKIALVDIDYDVIPYLDIVAKEVSVRGGVGVILSHISPKRRYTPLDDTLHTADSDYDPSLPPLIYIRRADAKKLIDSMKSSKVYGKIVIKATISDNIGYNVVGTYGVDESIITVTAHHDAHFWGAVDNASGVSMLLAIAKYLVENDIRTKHKIMFISFTAEEYGDISTPFGYLIGSHAWVENNKELLDNVFLNINMDALGYFRGPIGILTTPDLKRYVVGTIEKLSQHTEFGFSVGYKPSCWNDMWNFVRSGISSIHFGCRGGSSYYVQYYHTNRDTLDIISMEKMHDTFGVITYFILDVDSRGRDILDYIELFREIHDCCMSYGECKELSTLAAEVIIRDLNKTCIDEEYYDAGKKILSTYFRLAGWYPTAAPKPFYVEYIEEIKLLEKIADAIRENDYDKALSYAEKINLGKWAKHVSKETFYYVWERIKKPKNWGKYNMHKYFDVYELMSKLKSKTLTINDVNNLILDRRENLLKEAEEIHDLILELKSCIK